MLIISEELARDLVTTEAAIQEVTAIFSAMARGDAKNYPVVRESVGHLDAVYGVKSGAAISQSMLGLKAGGYWPHNAEQGLGNHQSSTLMYDIDTGRASALVSANYLTGVRTGAASAIATKYLSRPDATVLGIIGTGKQAQYQLKATMSVRDIRRVHAWSPSADSVGEFGKVVNELGLEFSGEATCEAVVRAADILITVTPSFKALVVKSWVRPGTHISAMGCDTKGKQELDPDLVAASALFVDEVDQAISIGEFQHAFSQGLIDRDSIRARIGDVINASCDGRRDNQEVTIFDGTGVGLQDLAVAALAIRLAKQKHLGTTVDY